MWRVLIPTELACTDPFFWSSSTAALPCGRITPSFSSLRYPFRQYRLPRLIGRDFWLVRIDITNCSSSAVISVISINSATRLRKLSTHSRLGAALITPMRSSWEPRSTGRGSDVTPSLWRTSATTSRIVSVGGFRLITVSMSSAIRFSTTDSISADSKSRVASSQERMSSNGSKRIISINCR